LLAGDNHSVLLTTKGEIYTFGYNITGQCGTGKTENVVKPTKVSGLYNIMKISAGKAQTIVLGRDRKLYSTGSNTCGELGIGTNLNKLLFVEITEVNDMMWVDTGNTYSVAIKYDGDVYGFGDYYHGIQSIKTKTNSRIPVKIGNDASYANEPEITINVNGTKKIELTPKYTFNVFRENEMIDDFEFKVINEEIAEVNKDGIVKGKKVGTTWVKAIEKETGKEIVVIVRVIGEGQKYAPQIAGGDSYAAVLKSDGSIWSFGYNSDGQLGNDKLVPINIPSQANILSTYKKVVTGQSYTMTIREDGTIWAWGDNTYGVLGQGNRTSAKKPIEVQNLKDIVDIAAGENHAIALDNLGNLYTWGLNSKGELGNGETKTVTLPEKINGVGSQVISITAGKEITAFATATGEVYVFGDNSKEQIAKFEYDVDSYGQTILPARNLYYTRPVKVEGITDAVKVEALGNELVILKVDGSIVKVSKYATNESKEEEIIADGNMVDISAKEGNLVILDKQGKLYTYGENSEGQAGIGAVSLDVKLQEITIYEDKKIFGVGAGYKNNYCIDTDGFVYAAGDNTYGQLGNSGYDSSYTFTLVGDRNFIIVPETRTMKQPEEETVKIEANIFNVFNEKKKRLTDYNWESSNADVVTVDNGVLTAEDMGQAIITATDKLTGATATALRVVQPLDEQRIDTIKVNEKLAKLSGENKYEVSVVPNRDGTGTVVITTKDETDQISIDNGATYQTGRFAQDIPLDTNPKIVKIKVLTTNNKTVDYILTINLVSEEVGLKSLTVNGVEATPTGAKSYEIVVGNNITKPEITAITVSSKSTVSINNARAERKQTTQTVDMITKNKRVVPVIVTSESGAVVEYTLTIYKEDALTELEKITVNDVEATKITKDTYKAIIKADSQASVITATTLYEEAEVQINGLGADKHITTRTVATIGAQTIVKIYVTAKEKEVEYTLIIEKEGTENELALFTVTINGKEIKPQGNIYEAYVTEKATSVDFIGITVNDADKISIFKKNEELETGEEILGEDVHKLEQTLEVTGDITTYKIYVTDPEDETNRKEYVLNIKKPSSDDTLKSVTVGNKEFSREAVRKEGTDVYEVSIPQDYDVIDVIAVTNYELSKVSVDNNDYEVNKTEKQVQVTSNPTEIEISVETQNGSHRQYTLVINRQNSSKDLLEVTVDGKQATLSKLDADTYEYTLDKYAEELTIGAVTAHPKSYVAINTFEKEIQATYRNVKMQGKSIVTYITVTAEDGTSKEYRLIIYALPDNIRLESLKVNGVEAEVKENNTYVARVNKNDKSFELYAKPEDTKAKIQIGDGTAVVGSVSGTIAKDKEEVEVKIKVTAQDGTTGEYTLIVQNKSDDAKLAIIKVDGVVIEKAEDGKYYVDKAYLTEAVDVEAIANNKYAKVSINSSNPELEKQTSNVTIPGDVNYINIKITAEDGSYENYTVVVRKLSNNTNIEAFRIFEEEGIETEKKITFNNEGKAEIKIGNSEEVTLKAITEDADAIVSINGSVKEKHQTTVNVVTVEQRTEASIEVIAKDGTKKIYTVTLVRAETDNNLETLEVKGVDKEDIIKTSDNSYKIEIPDTMTKMDITAIAKSQNAIVKIENNEYSETNKAVAQVDAVESTFTFNITVKAESGEEKIYEITVQKVTDLGLKEVKANGIECVKEDGVYKAFIDADTEDVALSITPNNALALVSTKVGDGEFSESTANTVHIISVDTSTTKEVTILVKVTDPEDENRSKTHTIVITEKSHEAILELLKVDGKAAIKLEDNKYYAVTTTEATNATVYAKATNKYASVTIEGIGTDIYEITKDVVLSSSKKTILNITITAQDGKTKTSYVLEIERKSDNTSCDVTVNDLPIDEYDADTNTFTKYIERDVEKAKIVVTAHNETSIIGMLGETANAVLTGEVETGAEETKLDFTVTAENGNSDTYHINIVKKSIDNSIETVKVNDVVIEEVDGKYTAIVIDNGEDTQDANIEVKSTNKKANIQIGDGAEYQEGLAKAVATFKDGNRKITLNINVKPQDQNTEVLTKQLEIILKSDDNSILSVKNGDKPVTIYDNETHTYTEYVDKTVDEVTLAIQATSPYTTLKVEEREQLGSISIGNIDVKDKEEVVVSFTAISETGKEQEYKVKILKMSDNADAEHIFIDGVDVIDRFENANDVPTYICSIEKEKQTANIKVIAENAFANIRIGDHGGNLGTSVQDVELDLLENSITVPIVVTSQDGTVSKTYNIIFVRISNNTKITWLEVNDKHIIENNEGDYEVTVKSSEELAKVEITLDDVLAKVTIGGTEETGYLEETLILPETGDTIKTIKVTAQDGTVSEHKLIIHKQVNDLGLDKVYLNGRIATKVNDTTFEIDVEKGTETADIRAIAKNIKEYVSIEGNTKTIEENTYTRCSIKDGQVKIKIIAMYEDEIDEEKEYTLVIKEKEAPDVLEDLKVTIKVDEEIIKQDSDGAYIKVVPQDKDNCVVSAEINSETSKVKIKDANGETEYAYPESYKNISLQDEVTEVLVTAQNGAGQTKEYTVYIIKENENLDDAELKTLLADGEEVTKEEDGSYFVEVAKDANTVKLTAIANYEYAKVTIDDGTASRGTAIKDMDMTDTEEKTIIVKVESISGTIKNYVVNIYKEKEELALRAVYVDGRIARKVSDTEYTLDVVKGTNNIDIEAILYKQKGEYVSIFGSTKEEGRTKVTYSLSDNGETINIKASNGLNEADAGYKEKDYTLKITYVDKIEDLSDLQLQISVNDKVIEKSKEGIYIAEVSADSKEALTKVKANSSTTKVKIGTSEYQVLEIEKTVELPQQVTKVKVYGVNGAGDSVEEEIWIIKKMPKITGKVITQSLDQAKQSATITVYLNGDRETVIEEAQINPDGSFELKLVPGRKYDLVVTKTSYLDHTITNIELGNNDIALGDISIKAGDIVKTGEIEIDDLVALREMEGITINHENGVSDKNVIYDLNEDGVIDSLDINILKKNYTKKAKIVEWVNPNKSVRKMAVRSVSIGEDTFILPIDCTYRITSDYGIRIHPITKKETKHKGIDISGEHHTEVMAVAEGEVTYSGVQNGYGNCIEVKHIVNGETIYSFYAHLSEREVKVGDKVEKAQVIGLEGGDPETDQNPGTSTGHHLHFEMRVINEAGTRVDVDPNLYIKF